MVKIIIWFFLIITAVKSDGIDFMTGLKKLEKQNLDMAKMNQYIKIQKAQYAQAEKGYFPVFQLQGSHLFRSEKAEMDMDLGLAGSKKIEAGQNHQTDLSIELQQVLFDGLRIRNLMKAEKKELERSILDKEKLFAALQELYVQCFFQMIYLEKQNEILFSSIKRVEALLAKARDFYLQGMTTDLDTLEFSNRILALSIEKDRQEMNRNNLLEQLRVILNEDDIDSLIFQEEILEKKITGSLDLFIKEGIKNRTEIKAAECMLQAAEYRKKSLKSGYLPLITAAGGYHYGKPGVNFFQNEWMDYFQVGVNLHWELWTWGRKKHQVLEAEELKEVYHLEKEKAELNIIKEIKEAFRYWKLAEKNLVLFRKLTEEEKKRYEKGTEKYKEGFFSAIDIREMESAYMEAECRLIQSKIDVKLKEINLKISSGMFPDSIQ